MDVFFLTSEQQNILFLPFDYDTVTLVFICHLTMKVFSNLGLPVCFFFYLIISLYPQFSISKSSAANKFHQGYAHFLIAIFSRKEG